MATWLLEAGVPMQVIADLLGHSSVDTTAIYARVVDYRKYTPSEVLSKEIRELMESFQAKKPGYRHETETKLKRNGEAISEILRFLLMEIISRKVINSGIISSI